MMFEIVRKGYRLYFVFQTSLISKVFELVFNDYFAGFFVGIGLVKSGIVFIMGLFLAFIRIETKDFSKIKKVSKTKLPPAIPENQPKPPASDIPASSEKGEPQ